MIIDMLGQQCPLPVVEAKKALTQPGATGVTVLVDNAIAVQNLKKMADGLGYSFSHVQKEEAVYAVTMGTEGGETAVLPSDTILETKAFLLTGDQIGISEEAPAQRLMKLFLYTLAQASAAPKWILLVNKGVMLAITDADTLDDLKILALRGTTILACGACLEHYELTEKLAVGEISNMMEIVEILTAASNVVTL